MMGTGNAARPYYWFHDGVKKAVPAGLRKRIRQTRAHFKSIYGKWRIQRRVTRILGPQFRRSLDRLGLDITYAGLTMATALE
jgi:hypothetical protein